MIKFGELMEELNVNRRGKDIIWAPFYYGWILGLVVWGCIWQRIIHDIKLGYGSDYPWYAFAWLIGYQLFFFSFPINMANYYRQKGKYDDKRYAGIENGGFLHCEVVYCWLSLIVKSGLLWMVAGAFLDDQASNWATLGEDY